MSSIVSHACMFLSTAEYLGFTSYPPAYLSREARGKKVLTGVNFASAASGYYERTARLFVSTRICLRIEISQCLEDD